MPALQVRDFPQELYGELKEFAASNHRSMAQQTIAAVDQMIHGREVSSSESRFSSQSASAAERREKREEILKRAQQRRANRKKDIPSPIEMLADARKERDAQFGSTVADLAV